MTDLKPANIIIVAEQSPEALNGLSGGVSGREGDAHVDQSFDSVGPQEAKVPGHDGTPVVADDEGLVDGEVVEEADEVAGDV